MYKLTVTQNGVKHSTIITDDERIRIEERGYDPNIKIEAHNPEKGDAEKDEGDAEKDEGPKEDAVVKKAKKPN